jgi:hypothetical protein
MGCLAAENVARRYAMRQNGASRGPVHRTPLAFLRMASGGRYARVVQLARDGEP